MESFDTVLVQFQRLVVDRADEIFSATRGGFQDGARLGIFLGLRIHERGELLAAECARAVENGAVEILVKGDMAGIEGREREVVPVLKLLPIQIKLVRGCTAGKTVPAVGENDASDIPEQSLDLRQDAAPPDRWLSLRSRDVCAAILSGRRIIY